MLNGFGEPHTDRGDYSNLAFDHVEETTMGEMLKWAESAVDETFTGWKGGEFTMREFTDVYIGNYGECGEQIGKHTLLYWETF